MRTLNLYTIGSNVNDVRPIERVNDVISSQDRAIIALNKMYKKQMPE